MLAGIIGLPNVGKTTLFNALTGLNNEVGNYLFTTKESDKGIVFLKDERLHKLHELHNTKRIVNATIEFIDVPALVSGSHKGEGLGNTFLQNVRDVDCLVHVVRAFQDKDTIHAFDTVNPIRDIETIQLELNYADLEQIERRLDRIKKVIGKNKEYELLHKLKDSLYEDIPLRRVNLTEEELKLVKSYHFLSLKPLLYVINVDINDECEFLSELEEYIKKDESKMITLSAKIELELRDLELEDKLLFMEDFKITELVLNKVTRSVFELLNLNTFFTSGEIETKAWTFKVGMNAKECAGLIHSDIERGFIRAETVAYEDLIKYGSDQKAKEAGKVRLEGKEYKVKDGDVIYFRFNV
jgi:GTP-binding protein YchF